MATTTAPCVISRAAITTLQSASASSIQQASFEPQLEPNGNPQPMFGAAPHRKLAQHVRNARRTLGRFPANIRVDHPPTSLH